MHKPYPLLARQVGDRPRHLEHTGVATRREAEGTHRPFQEAGAPFVVPTMLPHIPCAHVRITEDGRPPEALALHPARLLYPRSHLRGPFALLHRGDLFVRQRRHLDVEVDTVQQRTGNAPPVSFHLPRGASARPE